ncbi:MAG: biotin transporter BioY [Slackia piriformis]|uniref:Biotin transporter n=1 Tax=Slackia piriformis TaxID=626934 RepID=A0A943USG8_9ACTN|nr:biotin transporter BioY [Slackia piriformis]
MKNEALKRTETVAFCGLAIALLAISAWVTVPLGPVPFTLQTMVLVFVVVLFPPREALVSVFGYLALGAIGVPVFSGMKGGLASIVGPTGGFLVGFGIGAILAVLLLKAWREPEAKSARMLRAALAAVVLLLTSYVCGWLQLMALTGMGPAAAFAAGIAPFIVLDAIKLSVGVALAQTLKNAVPALRGAGRKA